MSHTFTCSLHTLLVYLVAPLPRTNFDVKPFFVASISATVHVSGDTELISSVTGAWALLFSFPFLPLSFQRKHCGKLNLLWHYFLILFFGQKFSCTERSKVNVSLFREMEVLLDCEPIANISSAVRTNSRIFHESDGSFVCLLFLPHCK